MHMLFPPRGHKGSKDLGKNGPVRKLQTALNDFLPEIAENVGLTIDGDYGDRTGLLVLIIQMMVNQKLKELFKPTIAIDQHFGPATRANATQYLSGWPLDHPDAMTTSDPESTCMYVGDDSPEPKLWPPAGVAAA